MKIVEEGIEEKHFLENKWILTYKPNVVNKKKQSENDWLATFKHVHNIESIEMFWSVKNNIASWSSLHHGSIYAFFQKGINPSWEDPKNKKGCSYIFYFNKTRTDNNDLDNVFESSLVFLIGHISDFIACVNGITFERKRNGDKMIVWCNAHSKEMFKEITNGVLPEKIRDETNFESGDLTDNRYKVSVRVVDHQSELKRINSHTPTASINN